MLKKITELSKILNNSFSAKSILSAVNEFFKENFICEKVEIYTLDFATEQLRDFSRNWLCIDDIFDKKTSAEFYQIYTDITTKQVFEIKNGRIYFPLKQNDKFIGMLEVV